MAIVAGILRIINGGLSGYWLYFSVTMIVIAGIVGLLALLGFSPILNKFYNKKSKKIPDSFNAYFFGDIRHFFDFKNKKHLEYIQLLNQKSSINLNKNSYLPDGLDEDLAMQIITNSQIAFRKFKLFGMMVKIYFIGIAVAFTLPFVVHYFESLYLIEPACCKCCCL